MIARDEFLEAKGLIEQVDFEKFFKVYTGLGCRFMPGESSRVNSKWTVLT